MAMKQRLLVLNGEEVPAENLTKVVTLLGARGRVPGDLASGKLSVRVTDKLW